MDENRRKPFQFGLASLFGLTAAVSVATCVAVIYPWHALTVAWIFLVCCSLVLAFGAWISFLLGLSAALVWTGETLWRLFKKRATSRRGVA